MTDPPICPVCGTPLAQGSRGEMCPACLLHAAMGDDVPNPPAAPGAGVVGDDGFPSIAERLGARIDRYKLLEQIGEGGFGVVWMAEQEEPVRRRVALKIIKPGMDTREVVARFEAERQALAMMEHPNIASVFDGGATDTGRPYFVMELVKGVPITTYCDANQLSTRERLELFMEVCHAVQHAHQKGVIHRDLKPSNILVTVKDDHAVPKVIDFGVAKATQARLTDNTLFTRLNQWIGTPEYMSPEQAGLSSLDVDTRSDIYSLGVLLYELLTGRPPFDTQKLLAAGYDAVMRVIREEEPPKPSTRLSTLTEEELSAVAVNRGSEPAKLNRLVRGDLDWIVMKALEKDRRRRYETANGLAADLEHHLHDEPVEAGAPSAAYRLGKLLRKHRTAVSVAAAFVVLLTLATAVSMSLAFWANRERTIAITTAQAEAKAKAEAQAHKRRVEEALAEMQILQAEDFFAANDAARAVAVLADVLSQDRSNRVAAERLLSALTFRNFCLPLTETLQQEGVVYFARFSPDGRRVVTSSSDNTARVWDVQTGQPLTASLRHDGLVQSAQFSPDGRRVVTASEDWTARLWDAQTGQPLTDPLRHDDGLKSARFSPDGRRVVTASWDNTARVWDAQTGQPLTEPLRHKRAVVFAEFSPDGRRVVTASFDWTARVWDAQTGQPLTEPLQHPHLLHSARFSPDGRRVVTACHDKTARVWDAQTGEPLTEPLRHEAVVLSAQFSPDGLRVVTASADKTARVWDAQTGQPLTEPLRHKARVWSPQFSPDGLRVVTASADRTARIWDAKTGKQVTEPLCNEGSAQFSPDGLRMVTTSDDKTARVWNPQPGQALTEPLRHEGWVHAAQFSPDGRRVVTATQDGTSRLWDPDPRRNRDPSRTGYHGTAQVWDAQTGKPLTAPLRHEGDVNSAQFSPDGRRVVTAAQDETARVWDAQTGQPLTEPLRHDVWVRSARFSPDGKRVVTGAGAFLPGRGYAQVWDAQTGEALTAPLRHQAMVVSAQFSPDGRRVVTASEDETARVWDAQTGEALTEPLRHEGYVKSAQFSPEGLRVVTASWDNTARVWDAQTGKPLTEPFRHEGGIYLAQFSPDGRRVVTASEDGTARVWDAQTGKPLIEPLVHQGEVYSAQFSPDGLRVVTASGNGTARVWDAQSGHPLSEPLRHEAQVWSAEFSPDGLQVVTASEDRTARVWRMPFGVGSAPSWLPRLAVSIAGKRLAGARIFEPIGPDEFLKLRKQLTQNAETNDYTEWAKWFCADRSTRAIAPLSGISVPEYVQRRIGEETLASLREAVALSPTNGQAFARLARQVLTQSEQANPRRTGEADFLSRRALELSPDVPEVQDVRAGILRQIKNSP